MDSRDSSVSVDTLPDDDGVVSVSASLAKEASVLFQSEKFVECVQVLNQLMEKKQDDPKVSHKLSLLFGISCCEFKFIFCKLIYQILCSI